MPAPSYPSDPTLLKAMIDEAEMVAEAAGRRVMNIHRMRLVEKLADDPRFKSPEARASLTRQLEETSTLLHQPHPPDELISPYMCLPKPEKLADPALEDPGLVQKEARRIRAEATKELVKVLANPEAAGPAPREDQPTAAGIADHTDSEDHEPKEVAPLTPDELIGTMKDILTAMVNLQALDRATARPLHEVVKAAGLNSVDARNVRSAVRRMKREGLIKAERGQGGGYWITPKGREFISPSILSIPPANTVSP
jgi:hypothetical protein